MSRKLWMVISLFLFTAISDVKKQPPRELTYFYYSYICIVFRSVELEKSMPFIHSFNKREKMAQLKYSFGPCEIKFLFWSDE